MIPEGYRDADGLLWPAGDVDCLRASLAQVHDLEQVYPYCKGFKVAVQAGGNCGIWPAALAKRFEKVYTFEPDPTNFRCLCANAPGEDVFKFNAALGDFHETIELSRQPQNAGAHFVSGAGAIPTLRIDDLALKACDLICLDIEGREHAAIMGAMGTIRAHKPVIVLEDKGLSAKYGIPKGYVRDVIVGLGYRVEGRLRRDIIFAPTGG